jgi:hypothetical protein
MQKFKSRKQGLTILKKRQWILQVMAMSRLLMSHLTSESRHSSQLGSHVWMFYRLVQIVSFLVTRQFDLSCSNFK